MALMGIDVGTTGVKCTITDNCGEILSSDYEEYFITSPNIDEFELDPNIVWNSTKKVIKTAAQVVDEQILGVSISSFGESFVPIDKDGNVLYHSMVYTDKRGIEENKELCNAISSEQIQERTGLLPSSTYSLPKMMWLKKNEPMIYSKIWKFLPYGSFLLFKLGGVTVVDYSLAARTMVFNVKERIWDNKILEVSGIAKSLLPDVYEMGTNVGIISEKIADELNVSKGIKLVTGAHDQICCAIGSGVHELGTAMDGMGSVDCICPVFNENQIDARKYDTVFPTVPYVNNTYTTYAYIYDGGTLLKWYRDKFGQSEVIEATKKGLNVYDIYTQNAPTEPTNIFVLPHFSGSACPYMDEEAKGAIIGLDIQTDKNMIFRAILEGISFELKINLRKLQEAGIEINSLIASGGGSRSDFWLQIKADIFNKPIKSLKMKEAGTLGVIIITSVAEGLFSSLEEGMDKMVEVDKVFYPNPENVQYYSKRFEQYKRIYEAQKSIFTS